MRDLHRVLGPICVIALLAIAFELGLHGIRYYAVAGLVSFVISVIVVTLQKRQVDEIWSKGHKSTAHSLRIALGTMMLVAVVALSISYALIPDSSRFSLVTASLFYGSVALLIQLLRYWHIKME